MLWQLIRSDFLARYAFHHSYPKVLQWIPLQPSLTIRGGAPTHQPIDRMGQE